jgi:hypothetical protein
VLPAFLSKKRDRSSRFFLSCLPAGRCSCTQDLFVMRVKPGLAHLHAIKILHHDKFLAPRQIVPRHFTSAHLPAFCNRDKFSATYQNCTSILVNLRKFVPGPPSPRLRTLSDGVDFVRRSRRAKTAKTRAIPLFVAKSGNTTSPYCRAVRLSKNLPYLLITKNLFFPRSALIFVS